MGTVLVKGEELRDVSLLRPSAHKHVKPTMNIQMRTACLYGDNVYFWCFLVTNLLHIDMSEVRCFLIS